MNINMKKFRESSDLILKDIYVTDELKRKTLEKCTDRSLLKSKPLLAAALSIILAVSLGTLMYSFNKAAITDNKIAKSIDQKYNNSSDSKNEIQRAPDTAGRNNLEKPHYAISNNKDNKQVHQNNNAATKDSNTALQKKSTDTTDKSVNTVPQIKSDSDKSSGDSAQNKTDASHSNDEISPESKVSSSLAFSAEPLTVEKAEEYFQSTILLPSYIPEGFMLTDISIPDDKIKCIRLKYSSGSGFFEILQSKNLSGLEGTSSISIGNNTAYISSVKDEKTNIITTNITWIKDNIQYTVSSSLPEDSIIKIAESLN